MNNRFILLVRYGMKWLGQSQRGICGTVFSHNIGAFANRCRLVPYRDARMCLLHSLRAHELQHGGLSAR